MSSSSASSSESEGKLKQIPSGDSSIRREGPASAEGEKGAASGLSWRRRSGADLEPERPLGGEGGFPIRSGERGVYWATGAGVAAGKGLGIRRNPERHRRWWPLGLGSHRRGERLTRLPRAVLPVSVKHIKTTLIDRHIRFVLGYLGL